MEAPVAQPRPLHIVSIAGGGGGPVMAKGLHEAFPDAQVDIVVPIHDYGGASQKIRDAYAEIYGGIGAPGDVTAVHCGASQRPDICAIIDGERFGEEAAVHDVRAKARQLLGVMAMANADVEAPHNVGQARMVRVLAQMARVAHRIHDLNGTIQGQTVRNMLLTALWLEHEGDMVAAVDEFGQWVDSPVRVIPAAGGSPHLALMRNGQEFARGENTIDEMRVRDPLNVEVVVDQGRGKERAKLTAEAYEAISAADVVIVGPGSIITSVGGALAVDGVAAALEAQRLAGGKLVGVANLYCEQKDDGDELITLDDLAQFLGHLAGRDLDYLIYNTDHEGLPVGVTPLKLKEDRLTVGNVQAIGRELVAKGVVKRQKNDMVKQRTKVHTNVLEIADVIKYEVLSKKASQNAAA